MKNTIVVDLDGTIANLDHRLHLIAGDKPDWDEFYKLCDGDTVNEWAVDILGALFSCNRKVIIVSARRDTELTKTKLWLKKNNIVYDEIFLLRKDGDYSPDTELKKKWLYAEQGRKEDIICVIDDRQKVVDMWRGEGLVCLQCYAWEEK